MVAEAITEVKVNDPQPAVRTSDASAEVEEPPKQLPWYGQRPLFRYKREL
jgi:hypothetical protein